MREYRCGDEIGVTVRAPETCCLFCKHCSDIFWDMTSGPYAIFCYIHDDPFECDGIIGRCIDFEEDPNAQ